MRLNDTTSNPALFARLAGSDGFALTQRSRALHCKVCYARAQPIAISGYVIVGYVKFARILRGEQSSPSSAP